MASLRETKDRIGSVRSTLKITSAMKLVSSAKLRKAQSAISNMLPYQQALGDILASASSAVQIKDKNVGMEEVKAPVAIVAISSNSSLCGGFNAQVIKATVSQMQACDEVVMIPVGRKVSEALKKMGHVSDQDLNDLIAHPAYDSSAKLADRLCMMYEQGEVSKVLLVYNHFISNASQKPVCEQFLPMEKTLDAADTEKVDEDIIMEPSASEILEDLRPKVLRLKIYTAMLDSAAAEHAARAVAMQTATDNGENLLSELTLEYNKGRQQKITSEILDLIGGAQ